MTGHVLCTGIDFDAGNHSIVGDGFDKRSAVLFLLADCLVAEDGAADALTETGRGYYQLPIGAPGLLVLGDPQSAKPFVAGGSTFIHRQQTLVASDQRPRGVDKLLRIHFCDFQLRFSGKSWPCRPMCCLGSMSLF